MTEEDIYSQKDPIDYTTAMNSQILENYNYKVPTWAKAKGSHLPPKPSFQVKEKGGIPTKQWAKKVKRNCESTISSNSKFIDHYYGGETGPDYELIVRMEQEIVEKTPNVQFDDIAELHDAKQALKEAILLPILLPDFYQGIRRPWKGVMLFGPPGTGKTMLAKAVATMGKSTFFNVSAASLASKWRGESEKMILFQMARFYAPSTIFFDEMDALFAKSNDENESTGRVKAELLVQMDGVQEISSSSSTEKEGPKRIMVLAATNRPWQLEDALIRRLEKRIYIPLPTDTGRKILFKINFKSLSLSPDVDIDYLCKKTEFYSGADITVVCREASMMPLREHLKSRDMENLKDIKNLGEEPITMAHCKKALTNIKPSVNKGTLEKYRKWMADFGCI